MKARAVLSALIMLGGCSALSERPSRDRERDAPTARAATPAVDAGRPQASELPTTPDTPVDPAVEHVLSSEQAACIGVDQAPCSSCHRRQGSFLLLPRGLPAHPGTAEALLERCL